MRSITRTVETLTRGTVTVKVSGNSSDGWIVRADDMRYLAWYADEAAMEDDELLGGVL